MVIIVFTTIRHWTLWWIKLAQYTNFHTIPRTNFSVKKLSMALYGFRIYPPSLGFPPPKFRLHLSSLTVTFRITHVDPSCQYKWEALCGRNILTYPNVFFSYLLIYLLTYFMQQSPSWEAKGFSSSQEFPRISWNPKVHYHIHKCPPTVTILSQLDQFHTPTFHFLKNRLNVIPPFSLASPKWSPILRFPHQNPVYTPLFSSSPCLVIFFNISYRQMWSDPHSCNRS